MKTFFKFSNPEKFTGLEIAAMEGGSDINDLKEISANTAMRYLHKTYDTKGYRDHTPQTKKGIERATRKVSQDAMQRDYERSSRLGLSTENVNEVSMGLLTRYKEKATQQASAMNKAIGDVASSSAAPEHKKAAIDALVKKGNKRFSGVVRATNKQFDIATKKEEVEMTEEKVSVNKKNYSWGKMVTVHHGSSTSYPLHPEHPEKIKNLKSGEKTSFKDETNRTVTAHREGDNIHLSAKGSDRKTTVSHSHFTEQIKEGTNDAKAGYNAKLAMASNAAASRFGSTKPWIRTKSEPELKHRVSVTVSDPQHTMISKRGEKMEKKVRLYAKDEKDAEVLARHHFKKQGYKVHDTNYIGITEDTDLEELNKPTLASYIKKAALRASLTRQTAGEFRAKSDSAKKLSKKQAWDSLATDWQDKARKRETNIGKAADRLAGKVSEAPETYSQSPTSVPFTGGTPNKGIVMDKSGAKHSAMSRVRHLARVSAMAQMKKKETSK